MKKLESLKLNKFKAYELKKESHNMVLGGTQVKTGPCQVPDTADDKSMTVNGGGPGVNTWPASDIKVNKVAASI